jgi:hypothetical protein
MTKTGLLGGAMALTWLFTGQAAFGQETVERLPDMRIETRDAAPPAPAYAASDPVDSGTSVISRRAIEDRAPGSGDVIETLKILPHAFFDANQGRATQQDLQDLRPADVSLSGGNYYDNYFALDGIGVNSRLDVVSAADVSSNVAQNFNETAGASAQSIWVDSNLIDSVNVRDSNISAQYGGFTGGVVEVKTRQPGHVFGGTLTYGCTNEDLTHFKIPSQILDNLGGVAPQEPIYDKCRVNATVDLPVNDKVRLLLGVGRQKSEVTYYRGVNYGGAAYGLKSSSENYLAKAEIDLAPNLTLRGQVGYTPYRSENSTENAIDATMTQHGGGWTGKLELEGERGAAHWTLEGTYARADSGRQAPSNNFSWPSASTYADWCSATNCTIGSFGDLDQSQTDYGLKARWTQPLAGGELRLGADYSRVEAEKSRPETNYAYSRGAVDSRTVCATGDVACKAGDVALTQYLIYEAYDIDVALDSVGAFAEYEWGRGPLTVRGGVRYDYESLLGNHNFAPRLSVVYALPWDVTATVGANRYYNRELLAYALQSAYPANSVYRRTSTVSSGQLIYGDWTLYSYSKSANYSGYGLATPYSDELTFALARPLFGGQARIKGVAREGHEQFTRGEPVSVTYTRPTGGTSTYTSYTLTNDGESSYRGLSLEWTRRLGRHAFALNGSWSKTRSNVDVDDGYTSESQDVEYGDTVVYYHGALRNLTSVLAETERLNYAAPGLINADWSADWWRGRVRTNLNARWQSGYDSLEATGATQTVDGVRYAVWDAVARKATTTFNASVQTQIMKSAAGQANLDIRITNLLDTLPRIAQSDSTSKPYRMGRTVWVGVNYKF